MARPSSSKSGRSSESKDTKNTNANEGDSSPSRNNARSAKSWTRLATPEKSPADTGDYRLIRLKNGIKILLISRVDHGGPTDPPWVSVYPESTADSAHGSNKLFKNDIQHLEVNRTQDNFIGQSNIYSHTPSTISATSLWASPISLSATNLDTQLYLGAFDHPMKTSGRTPTCAVALALDVGSHQDPYEFPGLAHLCEHLVHHGSRKFQGESEYHHAVEKLAGVRNAFTDKCKTNYHFEILQDPDFEGPTLIMEMLADLIGYPLFPLDSVKREIESVDNEYFMRKTSLHFRRDHLLNHLLVKDAKHPLRTFCIGSKEKLLPDTIANSAKRLQNALEQFHRRYYLGGNINMVVQASLDLDSLENCVANIFSEIPCKPNSRQASKSLMSRKTPYHNDSFNSLLTIKPLDNANHLTVMWALPPEAGHNYDTKPLDFISSFFDDSGPTGLEAYLKRKNLALHLSAGNPNYGSFRNQYASMFAVDLLLTERGRDRIQEVLESIFSYIALIKQEGITKENYNQLKQLDETHFKYFSSSSTLSNLIQLAANLSWCDDKEVLYGHSRLFQFDKRLISKYLNELTPSKAHFSLVTQKVGKPGFPKTEPIFGTQFLEQEIPKSMLKALEDVEIYEEFELPDWSASIPTSTIEMIENLQELNAPQILYNEPYFLLAYNPTPDMRTPQVVCAISLATPFSLQNCVDAGVADVWKIFLKDAITRDAQAWLNLGTSIKYQFAHEQNRFMIVISGLNYKMPELIEIIFTNIANFEEDVTEEKFYAVKDYVVNMYEGAGLDSAWLTTDLLGKLRNKAYRSSVEVTESMKNNLEYKHFNIFKTSFKKWIKIEMVLIGNASLSDANKIGELMTRKKFLGISVDHPIPSRADENSIIDAGRRLFPIGEKCLRVQGLNRESRMSTIHNYYILSRSGHENAKVGSLIQNFMNRFLFSILRTQQQLGYDVRCKLTKDKRDIGLSIYVCTHADKFCPCDIDARIDQFLLHFHQQLTQAPELTSDLLRRFGIHLSRQQFLDFYEESLTHNPGNRMRKVSIQVLACCGQENRTCVRAPARDSDYHCKKSNWLPDGKRGIPRLAFAIGTDQKENGDSNSSYFIDDIDNFHRNCPRYGSD